MYRWVKRDSNNEIIEAKQLPKGVVGYEKLPADDPEVKAFLRAQNSWVSASNFRDRFTVQELAAILTSANAGDVQLQILLLKVQTAVGRGIDLDDPEVIGALDYLVAEGILQASRPAEIRS